ncbi:HAD family hydrolase [Paratractidigestivibacter sp.]|uniref:HAD family hydrolase n=1 Tax=Paratractidigestivibacter sp. TaxID=2847316 RepID=UPI002ABD6D40|nr:HAD family hydrolase [Paratractidigestivibacter sp.]
MAIKLILTDIDGTILPYGKKVVSEACVEAFRAARAVGILVGPASGRFFSWIPGFFGGDAACCETALATNGSQVYLGGELVLEKDVQAEGIRRAMQVLAGIERSGVIFFEGAEPYLVQGDREDLRECFPSYAETCGDRADVPASGITKANVFICGGIDRTREVVALLNREVADLDFDVPQAGFSNAMPAGWNKGEAVKWLMEREGIAPDEAVVFGDAGNDLQMFAAVEHSVAVAGALPEAREAARWHIGAAEDDAVPAAIAALAAGEWPFTA